MSSVFVIIVFMILLFALGILFVGYDVLLMSGCPRTFWGTIFSFSHIWLIPGIYCIAAAFYRLKTKKSLFMSFNKTFRKVFLILFCIGIAAAGFLLYVIVTPDKIELTSSGEVVPAYEADYVILLGGGISKEGVLPSSVVERVEKASEYLACNKKAVCVVTGGTLKFLPCAEAPALKNKLVSFGVEADRVLIEDKALDTIQNLQKSLVVIAEYEGVPKEEILNRKILIVTSDYHLHRGQIIASKVGFKDVKGLAASTPLLGRTHSYVREICAYVKLGARILFSKNHSLFV